MDPDERVRPLLDSVAHSANSSANATAIDGHPIARGKGQPPPDRNGSLPLYSFRSSREIDLGIFHRTNIRKATKIDKYGFLLKNFGYSCSFLPLVMGWLVPSYSYSSNAVHVLIRRSVLPFLSCVIVCLFPLTLTIWGWQEKGTLSALMIIECLLLVTPCKFIASFSLHNRCTCLTAFYEILNFGLLYRRVLLH